MKVDIQLKNTKLVKIETDQTFDVVTRNSYMCEVEKISYVDFTFENGDSFSSVFYSIDIGELALFILSNDLSELTSREFCMKWMNYHASDFDSSSYSYYDHILGCSYLDKEHLKSINYYEKDGIVYEKENTQ